MQARGSPAGRSVERADAAISPQEVARYIAELGTELADIARAQQLDLLGYFLDMAVLEAKRREAADESA